MAMEKGNPLEKQQQQQEKGGKSDSQLWCSLRKRVWMIGLGSILRNLGHFLPHKLSGFFFKLLLPPPRWLSLCSSEENKFQEIGAGGLLVTGIEIVSIQLFAVLVVQTFPCHSQSSAFYLICRRGKRTREPHFTLVWIWAGEERVTERGKTRQGSREVTESRQSKQRETGEIEFFWESWDPGMMLINAWTFWKLILRLFHHLCLLSARRL